MRRSCALLLLLVSAGAGLLAESAESLRAQLDREKRRLAADSAELSELTRRLEASLRELTTLSRSLAEVASRAEVAPEEIARREEAVAASEQEARSLLDRRRLLADRVLDRRRGIAMLEAELRGKGRASDLLSGRWAVWIEPGEQRGVFRMSLDGTLVSGDYSLEGGYSGSLRGTLVGDRLRLERVDSRLGFATVFHGRLARDGQAITGTWESTTFGSGSPGSGRWRAQPVREEERQESP